MRPKKTLLLAVALMGTALVGILLPGFRGPHASGHPSAALPPQASRRPNVIVILADDLGYSDIACYGNPVVKTPHLDALAREGVRFTQAYSTAPICSPSRAGLLTGRYQQRFGFEFLVPQSAGGAPTAEQAKRLAAFGEKVGSFPEKGIDPEAFGKIRKGIPDSEVTLAQLFKRNGYRTAAIGKWHVGETDGFFPQQRGFDYHYGFYSGLSLYAPEEDPAVVDKHLPWCMTEPSAWHRRGSNGLVRNNQPVEEKAYLTDKFTDEALAFIGANKKEPFFLYLPYNAPHDPFQAKQSDFDKYPDVTDSTRRVYYGMISGLDDAVGRIVRKLKDAGLEDNTVIFFTSDNGGATYTRATDNAPLRGGKMSHFEGGYTVPYILRYPGVAPAGQTFTHPVSTLDIYATAAAAAGIALPPGREYDGVNLIPFLSSGNGGKPHETFYWRSGYSKAIRKGDYKLYINERKGQKRLFNLARDRAETKDLCDAEPAKLLELEAELKAWEARLPSPAWPSRSNATIDVNGEKCYFPI